MYVIFCPAVRVVSEILEGVNATTAVGPSGGAWRLGVATDTCTVGRSTTRVSDSVMRNIASHTLRTVGQLCVESFTGLRIWIS